MSNQLKQKLAPQVTTSATQLSILVPVIAPVRKSYAAELAQPIKTAEEILAPLIQQVQAAPLMQPPQAAPKVCLNEHRKALEARYPVLATIPYILGNNALELRLRLNGMPRLITADSFDGLVILLDAVLDRRLLSANEKTVS